MDNKDLIKATMQFAVAILQSRSDQHSAMGKQAWDTDLKTFWYDQAGEAMRCARDLNELVISDNVEQAILALIPEKCPQCKGSGYFGEFCGDGGRCDLCQGSGKKKGG